METWEDVAEHYRRAMLDAEALLNTIPARAHPVAVGIDPVAQQISAASIVLSTARHRANDIYYRANVADE